ncbi:hypothetical protein NCAS_0C03510 [Naumovozyma castellii]|uniref:Inositol polyphosphate-related phosphatase domain-containing protein n=1 Tax=Naumovozyma castellii TaxID=27288 RepID=G0VCY0_NAUCA|nr:hypothetical protein NCAS_0C03510 [Naumovozyma castellii CBS 4309]CCC69341.1 hypothetical protein NCAS_0C03510 [Naumovozyma castellii CBS 4309]
MTDSNWKVSITTFNCEKEFPVDPSLENVRSLIIKRLLFKHRHEVKDIYVFGFQELAPIWEGSFPSIMNSYTDTLYQSIASVLQTLFPADEFKLIGSETVGAIAMLVIGHASVTVNEVLKNKVRCGMLDSSLKGGIGMCCTLQKNGGVNGTFTFICSHLTANEGEKNIIRRREDFQSIMDSCDTQFGDYKDYHVFFFGDLNYRVKGWNHLNNTDYSNEETINELLGNYEEFYHSKQSYDTYKNFIEARINFPPTYKYLRGSYKYNTKRIPSWCDRILYRAPNFKEDIDKLTEVYTSVDRIPELQFTDHQPVMLVINLPQLSETRLISLEQGPIVSNLQPNTLGDAVDIIIGYAGWLQHLKVHYLLVGLFLLYLLYIFFI